MSKQMSVSPWPMTKGEDAVEKPIRITCLGAGLPLSSPRATCGRLRCQVARNRRKAGGIRENQRFQESKHQENQENQRFRFQENQRFQENRKG